MEKNQQSRRGFLKSSALAAAGTFAIPTIVPSSVFGANAPSNRINVGAIGVGRISRVHDMPEVLKYDHARIMAVSDVDTNRMMDGRKLVNDFYAKKRAKHMMEFRHTKTIWKSLKIKISMQSSSVHQTIGTQNKPLMQ